MNRKRRFLWGLIFLIFIYSLPIVGLATAKLYSYLLLSLGAFALFVYIVYRVTMRNVKLKYPIVSPEGHPDVYTGRMPRPIYEDMQRYPWFFKRKRNKRLDNKKEKKR